VGELMTPEQVALVKATWRKVEPMSDVAAHLFYERLFELDASVTRLFRDADLAGQKRKLVAALGAVVRGLDAPDALAPVLIDLGRRHARYGVLDTHFETVGQALLWTLKKGLGVAWTAATEAAWTEAYALAAAAMRQGLSGGTPARR
jgi:hemoglobin-like flavoprotein